MNIKELKIWIESLPEEYLEYEMINGEWHKLDVDYMIRLDKPITCLSVDEENKEVLFLNETVYEEDN